MAPLVITTATKTLTRTTTDTLEICTYKSGRTEVYTVDATGLPNFEGYYSDLSHTPLAARVHPLLAGHQAAHRRFWAEYLPGAANWLHAA